MDSPSESESTRRTRRLDRDCPASENKSMKTIIVIPKLKHGRM